MARYELFERVGFGGMAEVFRGRAVAAGGFEKPVAIKRILPHLSEDKRFVELLVAEAKILSQLRHRNIVQIYDLGLGADGQYFLVMEFVTGTDLGAVYERMESEQRRMPVDLAAHICAEVCDALDHAHRAKGPDDQLLGLIHRDVSPSNVLLSASGEVKLTDFGIAKSREEATGHGGVRGKFAYISPEQAANTRIYPQSDIFSLGIVLFELSLGKRLFSDKGDFDALSAVRAGAVPPPREVDPNVDPQLEKILRKCLARDIRDRYATAADCSADLRAFRYSLPEVPGEPSKRVAALVEGGEERQILAASEFIEPTMVRIATAAGFTATGLDTVVVNDYSALLAASRSSSPDFGDTEDDVTREMSRPSLAAIVGASPIIELGRETERDLDGHSPAAIRKGSPLRTKRDDDDDEDSGLLVATHGEALQTTEWIPKQQAPQGARAPRGRSKWLLLGLVSAAVAVMAFLVTSLALTDDNDDRAPDSGINVVDASVPDARPAKKSKKKSRKSKKRVKRRRKSTSR